MPTPPPSSPPSAPCRLEWRPSRWLLCALCALALLAMLAVCLSGLPAASKPPLLLAVAAWACWCSLRESRAPARALVIPRGEAPASVDGERVGDLSVEWRGPLATLRWKDGAGRARRLLFWPDTLPPPARRELRLAVAARGVPPRAPQMAP